MNESIDEWSRWMHAWRMLRRKDETINGAQRLHTVLVARAAQEFPETRASAHPRLMLRRREKKRLVQHHPPGRPLHHAKKARAFMFPSSSLSVFFSLLFKNILLLMNFRGPREGSRWIGGSVVGHNPAQSFHHTSRLGSDFPWAVLGQRPLFHCH